MSVGKCKSGEFFNIFFLVQDLGAPVKIDSSGYVLMDKMNLDSQTLITIDESKLQGLLILKVTDVSMLQTVRLHVQSTE